MAEQPGGNFLAPRFRAMGREPSVPADLLVGIHVLVVEDNGDARDLFRTILEYAGALVSMAGSADEALRICDHVVPDVVITDIAMPGHDGFWLLAELRRRDRVYGRSIPVVAVTGQGDARVPRFDTAGFVELLRKPVDPWELCRAVETHARAR